MMLEVHSTGRLSLAGAFTKRSEQPETQNASSSAANRMRLFEQVASDSANRRLGAAQHHRGVRLDVEDLLAACCERRRPHAEIDAAAQPLDGRDVAVAIEIAQVARHLALARELHRAQATQAED